MKMAGLHIEVEFWLGGLENGLRKQGNIQDWMLKVGNVVIVNVS